MGYAWHVPAGAGVSESTEVYPVYHLIRNHIPPDRWNPTGHCVIIPVEIGHVRAKNEREALALANHQWPIRRPNLAVGRDK